MLGQAQCQSEKYYTESVVGGGWQKYYAESVVGAAEILCRNNYEMIEVYVRILCRNA